MASRVQPQAAEGISKFFLVLQQIIRSNSAAKRSLIARDLLVKIKYGPSNRSLPQLAWCIDVTVTDWVPILIHPANKTIFVCH